MIPYEIFLPIGDCSPLTFIYVIKFDLRCVIILCYSFCFYRLNATIFKNFSFLFWYISLNAHTFDTETWITTSTQTFLNEIFLFLLFFDSSSLPQPPSRAAFFLTEEIHGNNLACILLHISSGSFPSHKCFAIF